MESDRDSRTLPPAQVSRRPVLPRELFENSGGNYSLGPASLWKLSPSQIRSYSHSRAALIRRHGSAEEAAFCEGGFSAGATAAPEPGEAGSRAEPHVRRGKRPGLGPWAQPSALGDPRRCSEACPRSSGLSQLIGTPGLGHTESLSPHPDSPARGGMPGAIRYPVPQ